MSAFSEGIKQILARPQGAELLEGATVRFPPISVDVFDKTGRLLWRGPAELPDAPIVHDAAGGYRWPWGAVRHI